MNQTTTAFHRRLVGYIEIGLFAALIYFAITYLKIQMPGTTMVHAGNALVVLSVLLLGFKRGFIASFLGLFIFDVLNGFAASVAFTLLEAALVLVTVNAVYT
ncbi:MAG: ECF transporter S component, partial [Abiotrophia defectiva]